LGITRVVPPPCTPTILLAVSMLIHLQSLDGPATRSHATVRSDSAGLETGSHVTMPGVDE
jgi:hypothetical protein